MLSNVLDVLVLLGLAGAVCAVVAVVVHLWRQEHERTSEPSLAEYM